MLALLHQSRESQLGIYTSLPSPPNLFTIRLDWLTRYGADQGAKYGYIWAGTNFVGGVFFFFFLPELKGRTLEEIDELFERRVPAWKFKSTRTHIMDRALSELKAPEHGDAGALDAKQPVEIAEQCQKGDS